MLQLPRTIRFATSDDIKNPDKLKLLASTEVQESFAEGYTIIKNEEEDVFDFFALVNINNSRLLDVFEVLAYELPELASLVFGAYRDDTYYGKYTSRDEIIVLLKEQALEVKENCDLSLNMVFSAEDELIQVQISETKCIKFWGVNVPSFEQIMQQFSIPKKDNLPLLENYPLVIKNLTEIESNAVSTNDFIEKLKKQFNAEK